MDFKQKFSIDRFSNLDLSVFKQHYLTEKKPVIITDSVKWEAINKWTPSYFENLYSSKKVALTVFNPNINMPGDEIKVLMPEAIKIIYSNLDKNKKHYLMQRSLHQEFPELVGDIDYPIYADKNNKHTVNFWFGEAGTNTKPHYDYSHNFLAQIMGVKRVRLFAPSDSRTMYPYSIDHTVVMDGVHHPAVQASRVADIDCLDKSNFQEFNNNTLFEGNLNPGDILFIPAGWWHEVKSLDVAMSVNFWWKISIKEFPTEQLTQVVSSYFAWYEDSFHEKIRLAFDLSDFDSDLQIAEFFLEKNLNCISAAFLSSYFQQRHTHDDKIETQQKYLMLAKQGDDTLLETCKIRDIIKTIEFR
jgi:ribosomal protein L16 Arg81 hydroxylase